MPAAIWGVQTHFGNMVDVNSHNWARDTEIHISRVRDEIHWSHVEQQIGVYTWDTIDPYMDALDANNYGILFTADFSNGLYDARGDNAGFPDTVELREAFADYVMAVLDRYSTRNPGLIEAVEIWNEPNGTWNGGLSNAQMAVAYTELLEVVYPRIKSSYPSLLVLGGATVLVPQGYWQQLIDAGALPYMDVASIHPYLETETIISNIIELRQRFVAAGATKPIWVTEFSGFYPDRVEVATYMVRAMTAFSSLSVERSYYYLRQDDPFFTTLGLLTETNDITHSGYAWKHWMEVLGSADYEGQEETSSQVVIHNFTRSGSDPVAVAWSPTGSSINVTGSHVAKNYRGDAITTSTSYDLTYNPIFIIGDVSVAEQESPILANTSTDYSLVQGQNGWTYMGQEAGQPEEMLTIQSNEWGSFWTSLTAPFSSLVISQAHPSGRNGNPFMVFKRWTSNYTGASRITASFNTGSTSGDGVNVVIRINGQPIWSALVHSNPVICDESSIISVGDKIDFAVGPGPGTSTDYDATDFSASIERISSIVPKGTFRTKTQIMNLLPDNDTGDISPQDLRDAVETLFSVPAFTGEITTLTGRSYVIDLSASLSYRILSLVVQTTAGTCSCALKINGTDVSGLTSVPASTVINTASASPGSLVATGSKVTLVVSSIVGATDLSYSVKIQRT